MKNVIKKIIFLVLTCVTVISCSNDNNETNNNNGTSTLNTYENKFIGIWQYKETPHPSGLGVPTSFYKSYFTCNIDRTAVTGTNEFITSTQNNSNFENRTFSATATTYTFTLPNGSQDTGNYEFIDATNVKMYSPGSSTLFRIYTKQNLNTYEVKLIGKWQYMVTPHPSGVGGANSYFKSYFICNPDRTSVRGFHELTSQQFSGFDNFTWSATATTGTFTLPNGTQETGNYEFIDATHVKMYQTGSTSFTIYTKQ